MPVSAYILLCPVAAQPALREALARLPGVEVGAAHERGLAVAVETPDETAAEAMGRQLAALPGVREAVLVYHHFEDLGSSSAREEVHSSP
ncbi:MAG: chaperone NapD [Limisphaera sp.]|nr:chaperone NapD [Limisphaera sp.]